VDAHLLDNALLQLIDQRLRQGDCIQIDGMGSFQREGERVVFQATGNPMVFLAYAQEDRSKVKKLFRYLKNAGANPWMDCQTLLPGQNWPRAVNQAIDLSDFFIACFSSNSVSKRGHFQSELAYALDVAAQFPNDEVFFIPVRLDNCEMPSSVMSTTQYVDLFPAWNRGFQKLIAAIRRHHASRRSKPA
jgi:hypothetical protein